MAVEIWFLGTGDAFGSGGRDMAAYLVSSRAGTYLVDCAPTLLPALKRHGLSAEPIDAVFLSHLHGDHFGGLPFLFLEYTYERPRSRPLAIAGPAGTAARVRELCRVLYGEDLLDGAPFRIEHFELEPGRAVRIAGATVRPFAVPHQREAPSLGLCLDVDGRRIVYSGDTGWCEELVAESRGADLFICECSFFHTRVSTHLDYRRIASERHRFGCKQLVLTHVGREMLERLAEVGERVATDGLRLVL
jgi:ribonuclease BN (tRNA processing enzyme)